MKKLNINQKYNSLKKELTEDQIIEKNAKFGGYCPRKFFIPYEFENTCISCGYNTVKQKH